MRKIHLTGAISALASVLPLIACGATSGDGEQEHAITVSSALGYVDPLAAAPASFQLLIVAPRAFVDSLRPLVDHKSSTGMPAFVVTMESVRTSPLNADDALKLKLVIKTAHEKYGARYVMLAGDQSFVPSRQWTSLPPPDPKDGALADFQPSDLYYANLYEGHDPAHPDTVHGGFASWDDNANGWYDEVYGPGPGGAPPTNLDAVHHNPDNVDAFPDVAVGRVPARDAFEIDAYVKKVIAYEKGQRTAPGATPYSWVADGAYDGSTDLIAQIRQKAGLAGGSPAQRLVGVNYGGTNQPSLPSGYENGNAQTESSLFFSSTFITYLGHGDPYGWDGWGTKELDAVANTANLPIVFAAACESGGFGPAALGREYQGVDGLLHSYTWNDALRTAWDADHGNVAFSYPWTPVMPSIYQPEGDVFRGMVISALFHADGSGAIAYMGDTMVTQDSKPAWLAGYLLQSYAAGAATLGDAYLAGQRGYWNDTRTIGEFFQTARVFLNMMALSGDPSLRLHGVTAPTPHVEPRFSAPATVGGYVTSLGAGLDRSGNVEAVVTGGEHLLWERNEPWLASWQQLFTSSDVGAYTVTAPPTVVSEAADDAGNRFLEIFALTSHGQIGSARQTSVNPIATTYTSFSVIHGNPDNVTFATSPGAGQRADGGLELFATASDGSVWIDAQTEATFRAPATGRAWSSWQTFGAPPSGAKGRPAVGVNAGGGLEVFVVANDGHLYGRYKPTQYGQWSGWYSLGGACGTDPAVGRSADGRLDVFLADTQHHLCHITQQPYPAPPWSQWDCAIGGVPGYITSTPAVVNNTDGSLDVFFRGGEGNLWHVTQTLDARMWSGWQNLGGSIDASIGLTNVVAMRDDHGRVEVYYRSAADGSLMGTMQLTP